MPWPTPVARSWFEGNAFDGQGPLALSLHSEDDGNDMSEGNRVLEIDVIQRIHVQKAAPGNDEGPTSRDGRRSG